MNHLSSQELLARLKSFVAEERRITMLLIEHLCEVERRLLFADLGYGSLFEFCTRELGLSEGSAQRRIQAMRLVKSVPEAKASLECGKLSLSNAARVQSFFQMEKQQGRPAEKAEKLEVLKQVETLSQRACEQKLYSISPQSIPQERVRVIAEDRRELKLIISEDFYKKLELLKGLLAHAKPEASAAELLEYVTDQALARLEKRKGIALVLERTSSVHTAAAVDEGVASLREARNTQAGANAQELYKQDSSKIPNSIVKVAPPGVRSHHARKTERTVWRSAQGRCQFEYEGLRCTSRYRLEIDHQTPLAMGGSNEVSNLRLLCRIHNTQQSVLKMRGF